MAQTNDSPEYRTDARSSSSQSTLASSSLSSLCRAAGRQTHGTVTGPTQPLTPVARGMNSTFIIPSAIHSTDVITFPDSKSEFLALRKGECFAAFQTCVRSGNRVPQVASPAAIDSGTRFLLPSIAQHAKERNACVLLRPRAGPAVLHVAVDNAEYYSGGYISSCDREAVRLAKSVALSPFVLGSQPFLTFSTDLCDNYGCLSDHFQLYVACRRSLHHHRMPLLPGGEIPRHISPIKTESQQEMFAVASV
jgi:hypothetical protein